MPADGSREATLVLQPALCCVQQAPLRLPGLVIPEILHAMDDGCGTAMHLEGMAPGLRVLRPGGRLVLSEPVATRAIPEHLRRDERLSATKWRLNLPVSTTPISP